MLFCFPRRFLSNYVTRWVFRTVCKRRCITSRLLGIFQWFHLSLLTSGSLNQCQLLSQLWAWCTLSHSSLSLRTNCLKLQKITTKSKSINNHRELFISVYRTELNISHEECILLYQLVHDIRTPIQLGLFIKYLFMTGLYIG